ncbi:TPA: hypothetical protein N0F65_000796 [Lagenidium giganteum]|uniref:ZSWIM1/3 RNaseH-like domain-containing protein n=1 Tax=Lagenidium giganteum TaxID=4803 RepID=A0AAV2ZDS4_9STRA|nr:TPA: hypothetical protein N0F65_000796 [Lagenidium giganteum]
MKEQNPCWKGIKSIVIDKDFVKWCVLEKEFQYAKVLLRRFHVISYLKHVLSSRARATDMETQVAVLKELKCVYRPLRDPSSSYTKNARQISAPITHL